jgi:hypothetical protein
MMSYIEYRNARAAIVAKHREQQRVEIAALDTSYSGARNDAELDRETAIAIKLAQQILQLTGKCDLAKWPEHLRGVIADALGLKVT